MNEFYHIINSIMIRVMLTGVITTLLLIFVLALLQFRDIQKYQPSAKPTQVASFVAISFYLLALFFYTANKRDLIFIEKACPVADTILNDGVASLEMIHQKAVVNICGVKFFEMHTGIKWNDAE